jgi:hypothetical protein
MLAQAAYANEQAGTGMFGNAAPNSALVAAASAAGAAELLWRPLADWPLLPLADGRLLKVQHRELLLAVLPEYAEPPAAAAAAAAGGRDATGFLQQPERPAWVSWTMLWRFLLPYWFCLLLYAANVASTLLICLWQAQVMNWACMLHLA